MTTITLPRATVEQALEALQEATSYTSCAAWSPSMTRECERVVSILRAALDAPQPEPVPVGWLDGPHGTLRRNPLWRLDPLTPQSIAWSIPLYTVPPPPQREPLTDKQVGETVGFDPADSPNRIVYMAIARAVERAHGIGGKP